MEISEMIKAKCTQFQMNQTDFAAAVHISFASSNGCVNVISEEIFDGTICWHYDIYLNDLRKVAQEKKGVNHD